MKRSELTMTGETYRLTPDSWGESCIMIDEEAAAEAVADAFDVSVDECDPDENAKNGGGRLEEVEIATDAVGNFYAILVPRAMTSWGRKTGEMANENMYMKCQNPAEATFGTVSLYENTWNTFDDEDDAE